jgi:phosphomannomutase
MLSKMAEAAGVAHVETLTGFKWIARAALRRPGHRFVFGYEEALGYEIGDVVADKDGLSAALVAAELAARAKSQGASVLGRLDELASSFGVHATGQWSLRLQGPSAQADIAEVVDSWRAQPPVSLAGLAVTEVVDMFEGTDDLPPTDALLLRTGRKARVVLRPSGTEPKLKAYFEVVTDPLPVSAVTQARLEANRLLQALREDVSARCQVPGRRGAS